MVVFITCHVKFGMEVLDVIRGLAETGMTMLVVSHEMGFVASVASRAVFLDHGRVLVDGPARAVFRDAEEPRLRRFLSTYLQRVAWAPEPPAVSVPGAAPAGFPLIDAAAPAPAEAPARFPPLDAAANPPGEGLPVTGPGAVP
ncbi:hypothetical protein ACFQX4_03885 [Roseomonas sp. GCM10028921]